MNYLQEATEIPLHHHHSPPHPHLATADLARRVMLETVLEIAHPSSHQIGPVSRLRPDTVTASTVARAAPSAHRTCSRCWTILLGARVFGEVSP
jgi:hypothetical protein